MFNRTHYIGITGITQPHEIARFEAVWREIQKAHQTPAHGLHVGIMHSRKVLRGEETSWAGIYPGPRRLRELLGHECASDVMVTLHYADYECSSTMGHDIIHAMQWCPNNSLDALQIDAPWPAPTHLRQARAQNVNTSPISIILQVGRTALDAITWRPEECVRRIAEYSDCITHVLLDMGQGEGTALQAPRVLPIMHAIRKQLPNLHIAVAGGLNGLCVKETLRPIVEDFGTDFSIDAQGKLCADLTSRTPLDVERVSFYLAQACELFVS
jgi:hypothetical protein